MNQQVNKQIITKTENYELELCDKDLLRLTIIISQSRVDVYEKKLNLFYESQNLKDCFDGFEEFKDYISDSNNVVLVIDSKTVTVIQRSKIKKKKIQIVSIILEFSKTMKLDKNEQLVDKIILKCESKNELSGFQLKEILLSISVYISQSNKDKKEAKQKYQQNSTRIRSIQQALITFSNEVDKKFMTCEKSKTSGDQQLLNLIEKSNINNQQIFFKNKEEVIQRFDKQFKQLTMKYDRLEKQIIDLDQKYEQFFQTNTAQSQKYENDMKQTNSKIMKIISLTSQEIKEEIKKIKNNLHALQDINGKRLIPELVKSLKCQNQANKLIKQFETERKITIFMDEAKQIPEIIGDLIGLQKLYVTSNTTDSAQLYKLSKLPDSFTKLKDLNCINFDRCISDLSFRQVRKLKKLNQLKEFTLWYSPLTKIYGIDELTQLTTLNIHCTSLKQFPNILHFPNIKSINVFSNNISKISPEIRKISQLQSLNIGNNPLSQLAIQSLLKYLKPLKKLSLRLLKLTQVPEGVFQLDQLQYLNLSENLFEQLPKEISNLQKLKELDIQKSQQLSQLPSEIGNLSELKKLLLPKTLAYLPSQIGNLQSLQSLKICRGSGLIEIPKEIGKLKKLESIDVSKAQLTHLPSQLCAIRTLTYINLENNRISYLPTQIGSLQSLTFFDLSNNQLTQIPQSFAQLPKTAFINLQQNPLQNGSEDFLMQMKCEGFESLRF